MTINTSGKTPVALIRQNFTNVRFKLPDIYICLSRVIVTRSYLRACDIALHHMHSCFRISFQSGFSIATCFRSLVFCSSFLAFYSSFFVYFFASPDQRNICKFTLCCDFQLVHQSLRNIVIYFLSVEPLFLIIDLHIHHNAFGLPSNFDFDQAVSIKWNCFKGGET